MFFLQHSSETCSTLLMTVVLSHTGMQRKGKGVSSMVSLVLINVCESTVRNLCVALLVVMLCTTSKLNGNWSSS